MSTRPAVPTELWSSQLRSEAAGGEEGRRRKKKEEEGRKRKKKEEGRKEKVLLIKSRDPHLAGGEKCMCIESCRYSACSSNYLRNFPGCRVSSIIRLAQKQLAFPGDLSGASAGSFDIFVMKLDDTGSQQWTYQTGTASADYAFAVETDASGNILLAGSTDGSMQGSSAGDTDIFVMQLDSAGSHQWTFQIGSNGKDVATALRIDASGDLGLAGYTTGDFGAGAGSKDQGLRLRLFMR